MTTPFDNVREALKNGIRIRNNEGGTKYQPELEAQALTALDAIEADHYSAADMASAAADGFRDGVASVQGQEPVAWLYESPMPDGSVFVGASAERLQIGVGVTPDSKEYPLYLGAAPVAQQPQAEAVPNLHVGNLPTVNQDEYTGLGAWWVQIWQGDQVFARAYGDTPREAQQRAERIAAAPQQAEAAPANWPTDAMIEAGRKAAASHGPLLGNGQSLWHIFRDMYAAAPHQAEAVPLLSDAEIDDALGVSSFGSRRDARAVEQAVRANQAVAVPMTLEQIIRLTDEIPLHEGGGWFVDVVRAAEKFHGIVGKEGA